MINQRFKNISITLPVIVITMASLAAYSFIHAQEDKPLFTENEYKAHLKFLADDMLEGRAPGTRGGDLAALYIASQFEAVGLQPISKESGYFQQVPLLGLSTDFKSLDFKLSSKDKSKTLTALEDIILFSEIPQEEIRLEEELIFVGYGVDAPEYEWDDFKGVDVKGKILVMLTGDPDYERTGFGSEDPTYYSWRLSKRDIARIKGSKGLILIHSDENSLHPFSAHQKLIIPELSILDDMPMKPLSITAFINQTAMDAALSLVGLSFNQLKQKANSRDFHPFPLGLKAEINFKHKYRKFTSPNVMGLLPGSSSEDEAVIYMAHYDHLGIRRPVKGDSIYNGARDNASGTAALICLAHAFASHPTKRSIIFLATTAEESWGIGNEYASNPIFPLEKTVIGLNMDMFSFFGRKDGFFLFPIQFTNAVPVIQKIGKELGLELHYGDGDPNGVSFMTDAFYFCVHGLVALSFWQAGEKIDQTPEESKEMRNFMRGVGIKRTTDWFHKPNDEIYPFWRYDGIIQSLETLYHIGRYYASDGERPSLKPENPFNAARRIQQLLYKDEKKQK